MGDMASDYLSSMYVLSFISMFTQLIVIVGMVLVGVGLFLIFRKQISFWHLLHILVSFIAILVAGFGVGMLLKFGFDTILPDSAEYEEQELVNTWSVLTTLIVVGGGVWWTVWQKLLKRLPLLDTTQNVDEEESLQYEVSAEQTRLIFKLYNFLLTFIGAVLVLFALMMIARFLMYNIFSLIWDDVRELKTGYELSMPLATLAIGASYLIYHWKVMLKYKGFLPDIFGRGSLD